MKQQSTIPAGYNPVPNLSNYSVSRTGEIWSNRYYRNLKPQLHKSGYLWVKLAWDGAERESTIQVHRMVALAFLPNPDGKPTVNHKDGNKANNSVDNLEWATMSENIKHGFATGLITRPKGIDSPIYGIKRAPVSEESKRRMSEAKLGRKRANGKWL